MRELPAEHLKHVVALEPSYLGHEDPIRQSGFSGGPERWRAERSRILDGIDGDGDLLDIGCANGFLLECLVKWSAERNVKLEPHGVDIGERLIELAQQRFPGRERQSHVANAWDWMPERRYCWVYMIYDCIPASHIGEWIGRALEHIVEPGGRLILGAYGSRSEKLPPFDVGWCLRLNGFTVAGESCGGDPALTRFAWIDNG